MYSSVYAGALRGILAYLVQTEVDAAQGLPGLELVGYLAGEVKEARERVRVALKNVGIDLPPMRITVNLSPADVRKDGTGFDLPIAVGILGALGKIPESSFRDTLFIGELGLDGKLRRVRGILPIVRAAAESGLTRCVVPAENACEGSVVKGIEVVGAESMAQLLEYLRADEKKRSSILPPITSSEQASGPLSEPDGGETPDFADIAGQEMVKRVAEIAAAGFHNMLIIGPPGTGKTMVGKRIPGILPPMTLQESMEVSNIYSIQGLLNASRTLVTERPFVSPHHTVSAQALAGGGTIPRPGAVSLAHRGVLFLDELPEFPRAVLDLLRQPLEEKRVVISRNYGSYCYPADFMLVAAMNPCPCGYYPDLNRCTCSEAQVRRYLGHISGPVLDRIDLCVEAPALDIRRLGSRDEHTDSRAMRGHVETARRFQEKRFAGTGYRFNSEIQARDMQKYCALGTQEERLLEKLMQQQEISARAYHRLLRTARTIADLEESERIGRTHLAEALCYRVMDTKYRRGKG
ncbi:MAG: YifB family Mg chelatase-like AAA ATPase [Lachnospiraceae bacterium]|nr:YifB family Mg chelatase-like AAA ATPase [Lachnospiraceae bacterium]